MSQQTRTSHSIYGRFREEIEGFDSLVELALDMRWSWNHGTDEVWRQLDPELWAITHNPWVVLQTVSRDRIERTRRYCERSVERIGAAMGADRVAVGA